MFNIFSHKEKVSQNYIDIPSHLSQIAYQENKRQQMLVRMWEKRNHYSLLVRM
jgi:hypothetical protein